MLDKQPEICSNKYSGLLAIRTAASRPPKGEEIYSSSITGIDISTANSSRNIFISAMVSAILENSTVYSSSKPLLLIISLSISSLFSIFVFLSFLFLIIYYHTFTGLSILFLKIFKRLFLLTTAYFYSIITLFL